MIIRMWEPFALHPVSPNSIPCLKLYVIFCSLPFIITLLIFLNLQFAITNSHKAVVGQLLGDGVEISVDREVSDVRLYFIFDYYYYYYYFCSYLILWE